LAAVLECHFVIFAVFLVCGGFPVDACSDDDMWLGHTKRNSRTQVYAGKKVRYLAGVFSAFTVSTFQLANIFSFDDYVVTL